MTGRSEEDGHAPTGGDLRGDAPDRDVEPNGESVAVALRLRSGADPIEGSLRVEDGPATRFAGWLHLTSLLQEASRGRGGRES